ncbi:MAG TPA: HEPN domain-containing protein [Candidatus Nanoarchaeia archaeon]|nr:HEPN domain-containing protein [Candidatus Nanoarchaeia archaeon]
MTFEDCKNRGLIKKNSKAFDRVDKEIKTAEHFLSSAKRVFEIEEYSLAVISSYNSCFHFARALLFKNNYVEKKPLLFNRSC